MSVEQSVQAERPTQTEFRAFDLDNGRCPSRLTSRQLTIGRLMATGAKDATIARQLDVSLRTVRSEISALIKGLGATSRFQAGCLLARQFG